MTNIRLNRLVGLMVMGLSLGLVLPVKAKEKKAMESMPPQIAKVDVAASSLGWIGKKITGQHNGALLIKGGQVLLFKDTLVGGTFTIDMTSITVEDLKDATYNQKLVGHLKNDDFFSTDKNPAATFVITQVKTIPAGQTPGATHEIKGDLTIKGITNPLSFPANVTIKQGNVTAEAREIKIDRTLYDIRYGSGKFFENLGDKTIDDMFLVNLKLVAKKG